MEISANGLRFGCTLEGHEGADAGQKPWLVLAHGVATTRDLWREAAPLLAREFRLLRYDIRGHGETEAVPGPYSFGLLCADVVGLMDALGIERAHFAGVSLGGMTGLGLALDHAGRFGRIAVCNAGDQATPAYVANWEARMALVRAGGIEAIVEPSVSRWLGAAALADPARAGAAAAMVRATSEAGFLGAAEALKQLAFRPRLSEIRTPLLYLAGSEDAGASPAAMQAMQAATPGSEYAEIAGSGHLSPLEAPAEVAAALRGFLLRG